jgi:hypothetical protein
MRSYSHQSKNRRELYSKSKFVDAIKIPMVDNKPWFLEFKRSCKRNYDGCALAFKKE